MANGDSAEISRDNFQKVREPLNFGNANHSTESSENSGAKLNGKKTFCKTFSKIWVYHARLSFFWKFFKVLFHSLLEVADNSNSMFWLNGKRPCWIMQLNLLFLCKISSSKFSKGSLSCSVKRLKSSLISERETFPPPPSVGVASVLVLVVQTLMLLV